MTVHADIWRPVSAMAKQFDGFATFTLFDKDGSTMKAFLESAEQAQAMADAFNAHQPKPATQEAAE